MERNIMKNNLKYFLAAPLLLGMLSCSDDTSDKDQFGNLDNTFKEVTFEKIYNPDTEKAFKNTYMERTALQRQPYYILGFTGRSGTEICRGVIHPLHMGQV